MFIGANKKEVVFFSKKEYLALWLRESWRRREIGAREAHRILGDAYYKLKIEQLDKEIPTRDEFDDFIQSRINKPKQQSFNPYGSFDVSYSGKY